MTAAHSSTQSPTAGTGQRQEVVGRHRFPTGLFENEHAYAARLVETATAILGVQLASKAHGNDTTAAGIVPPGASGSTG